MSPVGSSSVREYYYSTQPFLAWALSHFFYKRHFCYLAAPFHPYRLLNPTSSNPWKQFGAQYEPWVDDDPYDSHVLQKRLNLRNGVAAQTRLHASTRTWLNFVCAEIDQRFLLPVVYRVDLARVHPARHASAGSGSIGSNEVLIRDLQEDEFDVLFFDPTTDPHFADPDLAALGRSITHGLDSLDMVAAIDLLTRRCNP